jgi:hypothetical protein
MQNFGSRRKGIIMTIEPTSKPITRRIALTGAALAAAAAANAAATAFAQTRATPPAAPLGTAEGARPARVIWIHIDSLLPDAPERLEMRNWKAIAAEGTRVSRMTVVFPHHPTDNGFFPLSTTSLPNPTAAAGSLFLRPAPEQDYVQRHFPKRRAVIAGTVAYRSIAEGFTDVTLVNGMPDAAVVDAALALMASPAGRDVTLLRMILQRSNDALQRVGFEREAGWRGDAYASGSPYSETIRNADAQLGRLAVGLRQLGLWDDSLIVLMPDGAARAGWHAPQQEDGWTMPFAMRGPGIARGHVTDYAEHIDIAHTIAALMRLEGFGRDGASGRVMTEVLSVGGRPDGAPAERMLRFNRQQKDHLRLTGWMVAHAAAFPSLDLAWMAAHNAYQTPAQFWGVNNIHEWPRAGSFDRMLADNDRVIGYLREALAASGAPPLPDAPRSRFP